MGELLMLPCTIESNGRTYEMEAEAVKRVFAFFCTFVMLLAGGGALSEQSDTWSKIEQMRRDALAQLPSYKDDSVDSSENAAEGSSYEADAIKLMWEAIDGLYSEVEELRNGISQSTQSGEIVTVSPVDDTSVKVVSKITEQDTSWTRSNVLQLRQIQGKNLFDFTEAFGGVGTVVEKMACLQQLMTTEL